MYRTQHHQTDKKLPAFKKPEGLSPRLRQPATAPYALAATLSQYAMPISILTSRLPPGFATTYFFSV
jgi:hypothetical protein